MTNIQKLGPVIAITVAVNVVTTAVVIGYHEIRKLRESVTRLADEVDDVHDAHNKLARLTKDTFESMSDAVEEDLDKITDKFGSETHQLAQWIAEMRYGREE